MNNFELISVVIAVTVSLGAGWAMMWLKDALLRCSAALSARNRS